MQEGRIVLKNGHVGLNFYFIYSGSVFVNQEDETKQGRVFSRTVATLCRGDSFGVGYLERVCYNMEGVEININFIRQTGRKQSNHKNKTTETKKKSNYTAITMMIKQQQQQQQ